MEKKQLRSLAKEMNDVMGLNPVIDLKGTEEELEAAIKDEVDEIYPTDDFSNDAKTTLRELEIGPWQEEKKEKKEEETIPKNEKKEEKKVAKKKTTIKKKTSLAKKVSTKKVGVAEKNEFGFSVKSKSHKFIEAITKKPMTMSEVRKAEWNNDGSVFYNVWKVIEIVGRGKKDKEGRMSIITKGE